VVGSARPLALWPMPIRDVGHCGYDLSGQSSAPDDLVSGHVACDQPKEWHQRSGITAGFGLGQLQNRKRGEHCVLLVPSVLAPKALTDGLIRSDDC